MYERDRRGRDKTGGATAEHTGGVPGKRTLVESAGDAFAAATRGSVGEVPFRRDMEAAFGEDFSGVKSYAGGAAREGLEALGARAATQGQSIAFETPTPDRELVAHELTHVVQQRRSGNSVPQAKPSVSQPGDAAENEADAVASRAAAGERVSVSVQAPPAIHRNIIDKNVKVPLGEFSVDMKSFEKDPSDGWSGEKGTVTFRPNDKAPDSTSVRLTQVVKVVDLGGKTTPDHTWGGGEANRNKMRTTAGSETHQSIAGDTLKAIALRYYGDPARHGEIYAANKATLNSDKPDDKIDAGLSLTIPKAIEGGFFVDHLAADQRAKKRTAEADPNVPQDYVWPGEEHKENKHGKKAGTTIEPAMLKDRAATSANWGYTFETVARSDDVGVYYGTMHWAFNVQDGKVSNESHRVTEGVSHTLLGAVTEFDKFYGSTHVVMEGETLESLSIRYRGSAAFADDIYNANKAKIPDKKKLKPGTELAIPGVAPTSVDKSGAKK